MGIRINSQVIEDVEIDAEQRHHADSAEPRRAAEMALVLRRLIADRARSRGLLDRGQLQPDDTELDDAMEALLALELDLPEPTEVELRTFYDRNRDRLCRDVAVHAAHILFAVTRPELAEPLEHKAHEVLGQTGGQTAAFAGLARQLSNCPSGANGGDLGWLRRGESVPEFERVLFAARHPGIWPRPVATRFGWHLVCILELAPGRTLDFEDARASLRAHLKERNRRKASGQYLRRLLAEAKIEGLTLPEGGEGWLMQ